MPHFAHGAGGKSRPHLAAKRVKMRAAVNKCDPAGVKNSVLPYNTHTFSYRGKGHIMTQDELKKAVGWAALEYVTPGTIVGVGTGSTAAHFIDALGSIKHQIEGAVSSSDASTAKLKSLGIHVFDSNEVDSLDIYVDGADEINGHMQMIKGGGAAPSPRNSSASSTPASRWTCWASSRCRWK